MYKNFKQLLIVFLLGDLLGFSGEFQIHQVSGE